MISHRLNIILIYLNIIMIEIQDKIYKTKILHKDMKKSVSILFVLLLLGSINFVFAQCPITPGAHGVKIGDQCFDCGMSDGICPIEFGVTEACFDPDCPSGNYWSRYSIEGFPLQSSEDDPRIIDLTKENKLFLIITNTGLNEGDDVNFDVKEKDGLLDADDEIKTITGEVNSFGTAIGNYSIKDIEDLNEPEEDENKEGEILELYFEANVGGDLITSTILYVNTTYEAIEIGSCGDYELEEECNNDDYQVGDDGLPADNVTGSCTYHYDGKCNWEEGICIKQTWQYADSANPEDCSEAVEVPCSYSESEKIGDCNVDDFFKISYTPTQVQEGCAAYTTGPIPCPQKLKIPFFGIYGFIASIFIISGIYFLLLRRQEIKDF